MLTSHHVFLSLAFVSHSFTWAGYRDFLLLLLLLASYITLVFNFFPSIFHLVPYFLALLALEFHQIQLIIYIFLSIYSRIDVGHQDHFAGQSSSTM